MHRVMVMLSVGATLLAVSLRAEEEPGEFASAPAGPARVVPHFESVDRDADGQISMEEFRNRMTKVFFELDLDGDGHLQEDEYSEVLIAPHHELADADDSKTLSHREFMAQTAVLFEIVDSDDDRHFTKEELAAAGHEEEDR